MLAVVDLLLGHAAAGHDRELVRQRRAHLHQRRHVFHVAAQPLQVQRLHVGTEALVQPHVVPIDIGQLVAEPFVGQLVLQQPVVAVLVLLVAIAVGIDGLVLHAQVRGLDHAHLLAGERIRADHLLEEIQHRGELGKQPLRLGRIALQMPEAQREGIAETRTVVGLQQLVRADVERDRIGIRQARAPVIGAPAILLLHAFGDAVAGSHQRTRHADVLDDLLRFALRVIDAGPQQVATLALHRAGHPRLAARRGGPDEAAIPGRALGHVRGTGIADAQDGACTRRQRLRQIHRHPTLGVAPVRGIDRLAVDFDQIDLVVAIEIDHQRIELAVAAEGQFRVALQRFARRIDLEREIRLFESHRFLLRRARQAAGGSGLAQAGRVGDGRGHGSRQCDGQQAAGMRTGKRHGGNLHERSRTVACQPRCRPCLSSQRRNAATANAAMAQVTLEYPGRLRPDRQRRHLLHEARESRASPRWCQRQRPNRSGDAPGPPRMPGGFSQLVPRPPARPGGFLSLSSQQRLAWFQKPWRGCQ